MVTFRINVALFLFFTLWPFLAVQAQKTMGLDEAIRLALQNNVDLQIKRAEIERAKGEKQKRSAVFPALPRLTLDFQTDKAFADESESGVELSLSQEVEIAGQGFLRRRIGKLELAQAQKEWEWSRHSLILNVKEAFYRVLYLQEKRGVLQNLAASNRELAGFATERQRQSQITPFEGGLWRVDAAGSEAELNATQSELTRARLDLAKLLGMDTDRFGILSGRLPEAAKVPAEDVLLGKAFARRADLQKARLKSQQNAKSHQLAKRALIPNPELSVGYAKDAAVLDGQDFDGVPAITGGLGQAKSADEALTFGVSIDLPLWGGYRGEITKARAEKKIAELEKTRLERRITADTRESRQNLLSAAATVRGYENAGLNFSENLRLLKEAYRQGNIDVDTYLNQRDRLIAANLQFLEARWLVAKNQIAIERNSGVTEGDAK